MGLRGFDQIINLFPYRTIQIRRWQDVGPKGHGFGQPDEMVLQGQMRIRYEKLHVFGCKLILRDLALVWNQQPIISLHRTSDTVPGQGSFHIDQYMHPDGSHIPWEEQFYIIFYFVLLLVC